MLEAIDQNKWYYDEHGVVVIVGFVKEYIVWRRPRCAVQVCTLNDFARRFSETPPNDEAHRKDAAGGLSGGADCSAAP